MQKQKVDPKRGKSIPSLIAFGVVLFYSTPASAGLTINPLHMLNIDANASDSSQVTSMNPPSPSFSNGGNPNSSNSNNNNGGGGGSGGGGGGSSSPFVRGGSSTNSSNNSSSNTDNNDNNGTETNDIISLVSGDGLVDLIPQNSEINDLVAVASMLDVSGNNSGNNSGTNNPGTNSGTDNPGTNNPGNNPGTNNPGTDNPGTNNPGTDKPGTDNPGTLTPTATPIPEPTSVTALTIIGLVGFLAKRNNNCS